MPCRQKTNNHYLIALEAMSRQHWDATPSWPLAPMASPAYYLYTADAMEERGNMAGARAEAAVSS